MALRQLTMMHVDERSMRKSYAFFQTLEISKCARARRDSSAVLCCTQHTTGDSSRSSHCARRNIPRILLTDKLFIYMYLRYYLDSRGTENQNVIYRNFRNIDLTVLCSLDLCEIKPSRAP
eukprot:5788744-Pleurochrysis_carterae.AAC.1